MTIRKSTHHDVAIVGAWLSKNEDMAKNTTIRYTVLAEVIRKETGIDLSPDTLSSLCISLGYRDKKPRVNKESRVVSIEKLVKNQEYLKDLHVKSSSAIAILAQCLLDYSVDQKLLVNGDRERAISDLECIASLGFICRKEEA